jgi:hypothetical protein
MKINIRRIYSTASAMVVLIGAGVLAVAAPASARPAPQSVIPAMAGTTTAFDLNGIYTDLGSARPRISDVNDILTIDMSSQHRPTATGVVINYNTITVTFPDVAGNPYTAKLVAPGTINWNNSSVWQKLAAVAVPDVTGLPTAQAVTALQSAGLTAAARNQLTCDTLPGHVDHQFPAAAAQATPGSVVQIFIAVKPKTCT